MKLFSINNLNIFALQKNMWLVGEVIEYGGIFKSENKIQGCVFDISNTAMAMLM